VKLKTEHALAIAVGLWLWSKWQEETSISLPTGAHLPMTGAPHEVARVRTGVDPLGFPGLFNAALQVVDRLIDLGPAHSPATPPEPDPAYDLAARVFSMQAAFETDGGRAVYHFNVGNLTTNQGDYYLNPPSDTAHHYAVFLYPLQAAVAMVERVKRLWPKAYRAAYGGSVTDFAHALKPENAPQYYEGSEDQYRGGMMTWGKHFGWLAGVAGADDAATWN
jgi:hypothetical protein